MNAANTNNQTPRTVEHHALLSRNGHRWTFTCEQGDLDALLVALSTLADDDNTPFDWFDAAVVSKTLTDRGLRAMPHSATEARGTA